MEEALLASGSQVAQWSGWRPAVSIVHRIVAEGQLCAISQLDTRRAWAGVLLCVASSAEGGRPAWAWPISLNTTPNPDGVNSPLFSVSAICQI